MESSLTQLCIRLSQLVTMSNFPETEPDAKAWIGECITLLLKSPWDLPCASEGEYAETLHGEYGCRGYSPTDAIDADFNGYDIGNRAYRWLTEDERAQLVAGHNPPLAFMISANGHMTGARIGDDFISKDMDHRKAGANLYPVYRVNSSFKLLRHEVVYGIDGTGIAYGQEDIEND